MSATFKSSCNTLITLYLVETDNSLKTLFFRNGAYCWRRTSVKKTIFIPLDPQPLSNHVLK